MKQPQHNQGFTLVELIITLSIVAILTIITIPSFNYLWKKSQQDLLSTELLNAIYLSRSEAIARQQNIFLCGSHDKRTCSDDWKKYFIVTTANKIIYLFHEIPLSGKLFWRSFPQNKQQIEFLPSGLPKIENGSFWFCSVQHKLMWVIMLAQTGRARIIYPNEAGKIYDDQGVVFECDIK